MSIARALATAALMAALPALADFNDKQPITATVTGATPSGYPRTMVEGLNAVVRDAYPGSAVSFKPNSPGGGVQAIATKQADFTATATGTEVKLALDGDFPFKESLKGKFSYVMQLYDNQFIHFLMTKEWADANGVKSWSDIAAKKPRMRLAINRPDNPQTTIGGPYEVMKAHGFSINDIEKWGGSFVLGNSAIGLAAITDGKADVFMNARNVGDSLIKDIAGKRALLWIDGDQATIQKAADTFNFDADMVPAGTYDFMEKPYPTVRMWVSLLAGAHVPDEVVYKYVKALAENEARVQSIGGSLKSAPFTRAKMVVNPAKLPFHPGALRYYKEAGLVR
ncbi:MAG TPA: TAXI family TRAP transporter solute-binding subunit [Burkholderiales bacterium]|nr:TAXI family TRAP transporter solute-binding subunit [Burkholderiales bacterium]